MACKLNWRGWRAIWRTPLPYGRWLAKCASTIPNRLKGWTEYWQVVLGPLLVLSVIFFKRGLAGVFYKPDA